MNDHPHWQHDADDERAVSWLTVPEWRSAVLSDVAGYLSIGAGVVVTLAVVLTILHTIGAP